MRKIISVLLLLTLVFFSGCIQPTRKGEGVTLKLKRVPPDSQIEPYIPVTVTAELENTGEMDARNIEARLTVAKDWSVSPSYVQRIEMLERADLARELKGGMDFKTWELKPPSNLHKEQTYDISVEVTYDYSTVLEGRMRVVSIDYYQVTGKKGGVVFQTYTSGPIKISISPVNMIVSRSKVSLRLNFENVGKGRVKGNILSVSTTGITCNNDKVRLGDDGKGQLACWIQTGEVKTYEEFPISVKADYTYTISQTTTVTVLRGIS